MIARHWLAAAALPAVLAACDAVDTDDAATPHTVAMSLETDATELRALRGVPRVAVEGIVGPGGRPFFTTARLPHMTQGRCSLCHVRPLDPAPAATGQEAIVRTMHVDIPSRHAPPTTMNCRTCHDGNDLERLRLNDGSTVGFDHAYRLCVQCHFQQGRDWAGGAHGKRLAGWLGVRVVENCTACHDPHAPRFAPRAPEGTPRIPRTIRNTHPGGRR